MWGNKGCMEKHGKIIAHFHRREQGHNTQERQVISTAAYLKQQKPCMLTFRDKLAKIYNGRP